MPGKRPYGLIQKAWTMIGPGLALLLLFSTAGGAAEPDAWESAVGRLARDCGVESVAFIARPPSPAVHVVSGFSWPAFSADPIEGALDFLSAFPDLAGIRDPRTDLVFEASHPSPAGPVLKFAQYYQGLPVYGRGVIVRTSDQGSVTYMAGNAVPPPYDIDTTPLVDSGQAEALAETSVPGKIWREPSVALQVLVDPQGVRLVWAVALAVNDPAGAWLVFVDARTGELAGRVDVMLHALGRVYEQNPNNGEIVDVELMNLDGDGSLLTGEYASAFRYVLPDSGVQTAVPNSGEDFLYDPSASQPDFDDPFCEVQLYHHVDLIATYFTDTFGHEHPQKPLPAYCNYHQNTDAEGNPLPYNNAQFTNDPVNPLRVVIQFGQGDTVDFSYDASIVYHEFTHYVVHSVAALNFDFGDIYGTTVMPLAIHEGTADYYAATLTGDPNMSEYIPIGRHLVNDKKCPDDIMGLEPHDDGEVVGGAFWAIREAVGPEISDAIIFRGLDLIPRDSSFRAFAEAIMTAAGDMVAAGDMTDAQRSDVQAVLDEKGLSICDRFIALEDGGEPMTAAVFGFIMFGACDFIAFVESLGYSLPSAFQWTIDVPDTATTLTVSFDKELTGGEGKHWLYVRENEPVEFELIDLYGYQIPVRAVAYDGTFAETDGFTLTPYTDPPLEPGSTYYVTVSTLSCPMGQYHISAETSDEPVAEPPPEVVEEDLEEEADEAALEPVEDASQDMDAGEEDDDDGGKSGCGCRMAT
jgi:hypothetical protein